MPSALTKVRDTPAQDPAYRPTSRTGRLWSAQLRLTTNPDHNRIRHEPILADYLKAQAQVSDGIRQPARICKQGLRFYGHAPGARLAGGRTSEEVVLTRFRNLRI
jgi:hypothetical protein